MENAFLVKFNSSVFFWKKNITGMVAGTTISKMIWKLENKDPDMIFSYKYVLIYFKYFSL